MTEYLRRDDGTLMPVGHYLKADACRWDEMMDAIEAELYTFQWANPDRGDANRGEVHVERETRTLHLTVYVRDNENPESDELFPLDGVRPVDLYEDPREQIRGLIHGYLRHEADEQMWFANERPFYPDHEHVSPGEAS